MNKELFEKWFFNLKTAWETKNPQLAADICSENLLWYETPFDEPLKTKGEVLDEWQTVSKQEDISVEYQILAVEGQTAITQWSAKFIRIPSGEKVEMEGIFKVRLNNEGLCEEFHQWYNYKSAGK